jgi:hypothetical protein
MGYNSNHGMCCHKFCHFKNLKYKEFVIIVVLQAASVKNNLGCNRCLGYAQEFILPSQSHLGHPGAQHLTQVSQLRKVNKLQDLQEEPRI